jgi:hypothetical protein
MRWTVDAARPARCSGLSNVNTVAPTRKLARLHTRLRVDEDRVDPRACYVGNSDYLLNPGVAAWRSSYFNSIDLG